MKLGSVTPVLRIFDEAKAREFYLDYLGFDVVFEHRFEDDLPLYMGISRGDCQLHLTEHHGDSCPGSAVRVSTENIKSYHAELEKKKYNFYRPELLETPWQTIDMEILDPFGNKIIFSQDNS